HPAVGNRTGTLVNALLYHFEKLSQTSSVDRPGIVHRLDKGTSGLLLVAKEDNVFLKLQKALQAREIKRTYLTLVCGHMKDKEGTIDLPIGRSIKDRKKLTVTYLASRQAATSFKLLKRYRSYDLLDVNLHTGRTHQIRVHFSHLGHPVFGDPEYGGREKWHRGIFAPERPLAKKLLSLINHQALHAKRLGFVHPVNKKNMTFEAKLSDDFHIILNMLEKEGF
ncbi:MAG: RluA family pseudouridine synthase, partial [Candidatus Zixiibacteriota bacterium]